MQVQGVNLLIAAQQAAPAAAAPRPKPMQPEAPPGLQARAPSSAPGMGRGIGTKIDIRV